MMNPGSSKLKLDNLKLVSFPIEVDLGIPYVKEDELDRMEIYKGLNRRDKFAKFWQYLGESGHPYAKGLLLLPLSAMDKPHCIPSRNGHADWEHPNAREAIDGLCQLFTPEFAKSLVEVQQVSPEGGAKYLLSQVGLVSGTVSFAVPLFHQDLARWSEERELERFIGGLKPEWLGLYPNSHSKGEGGFILKRLRGDCFNLSSFRVTAAALSEKRRGFFFTGFAPRLSEKPNTDDFHRAQRLPVPFSSSYPNLISGETAEVDPSAKERKDTKHSAPDLGFASTFFACPRARAREWEKEMPEVWAKLYPKRYTDFPGYIHPKVIARMNAALLFPQAAQRGQRTQTTGASLVLPKLLRFFMPHYFLSQGIVDAIQKTKFPEDLKPEEVPLPVPGMIIVLPEKQSSLLGPNGTPIHYIIMGEVSAAEKDSDLRSLLRMLDPTANESAVAGFLQNVPAPASSELAVIGISCDGDQMFELPVHWDMSSVVTAEGLGRRHANYPPFVAAAAFTLARFVFNALLYFNAVPQYMEVQCVQNTVRSKSPKDRLEYWAPNIYGRQFHLPSEPEPTQPQDDKLATALENTRQGRKPRPHLRWAHWRRQWHGPGMALLKWIHIDFVWVEPTEDSPATQ